MSNSYADRTHCNYGHEFSKENTGWRKDGGGRWCRQCKREREAERYRLRQMDPFTAMQEREYGRLRKRQQRSGGDNMAHKNDEKRTAPHNMLAIKEQAIESWEEMGRIQEQLRTLCFEDPDNFIEFQDPRFPEDHEENVGRKPFPSTGQAEALCDGCPLLNNDLCLTYALKQKEDFGVWGGKRIVGGRVYRGQTKKG